jgi:hypothetical protein
MPYEVLIINDGNTEDAHPVCDETVCAEIILKCLGVPATVLAEVDPTDPGTLDLGDDVSVEVVLHGEQDSCTWCVCCGKFIQHGIRYEGEDVGCRHGEDEKPDDLDRPYIDFEDNPVMREYLSGSRD